MKNDNGGERCARITIVDERRTMHHKKFLRLAAVVMALGLLAAACSSDDNADATDSSGDASTQRDGPTIKVRGQDFSESATLAQVYGQYLEAKGYPTEILTPAGFRTEAVDALENGDVDLIIDYAGGSQTELLPDTETSQDIDEVIAQITPAYEEIGATVLDYSPAIDGDAFVVRGDSEAETISDVAGLDYRFGASAQCFERPQCYLGYTNPDIYNITFSDTTTLEFGPLLGENLANDEVDAVVWNTTAPEIEENGFKILEDDKGLHPAQNVVPIINTEILDDYGQDLADDLNALSAMITTEDLIAWNTSTDIDKEEPDTVATDWLESNDLL